MGGLAWSFMVRRVQEAKFFCRETFYECLYRLLLNARLNVYFLTNGHGIKVNANEKALYHLWLD